MLHLWSFPLTAVATLVVLSRIPMVHADWTWSLSIDRKNKSSCDIEECRELYNKSKLSTGQLISCFAASQATCNFNAIGDPGMESLPITCPGSSESSVASLDISSLLPPFGDSFFSNGSAIISFATKPTGSIQCDFFPYAGKYTPPPKSCSSNVDDQYWMPDPTNGVMTIMTKSFELSLYKVIDEATTGYYLETGDWNKCGGSIASVSLDSFNIVVSMAGEIGKSSTTSTTTTHKPLVADTTTPPADISTETTSEVSVSDGVEFGLKLSLIIGLSMIISL